MPVHLKFNDELLQEEIHTKFLGIELEDAGRVIVTEIGKGMLCNKKYETI
jgi:hypothetical protein